MSPAVGETPLGAAGAAATAMPPGPARPVVAPASVAAGMGEPVDNWLDVKSTTESLSSFATHRFPEESKASPKGPSMLLLAVAERVALGVGDPLVASSAGVNSTTVLLLALPTHRFPEESKANPIGSSRLASGFAESVTLGVGDPLVASSLGVNSTRVLLSPLATQKFPEESKAKPQGRSRLLLPFAESVTLGVGDPLVASSLGVNSATVFWLKFATHRSPEGSKARPRGPLRLPAVEARVTLGVGMPVAISLGVNSIMVLLG